MWDYTYDAENRLIAMQHRSEVIGTGKIATTYARRLEFKYDYLGRRVAKIVKGGWNGSSYPTTLSHGKFLYDGWNLVAEYTGATSTTLGTLVRAYTWGLDLAGTLTATGGVGALVQLYDAGTTKTYLPTYDGNGNVVSMVNASSGALEAVYEYDPFGNLLRSEGAYVGINPIRFSSKYTDLESGLSYYGHRYYSATLGRFINRDPIEEAGGLNLYGFCGNDGVNCYDVLGLEEGRRTSDPNRGMDPQTVMWNAFQSFRFYHTDFDNDMEVWREAHLKVIAEFLVDLEIAKNSGRSFRTDGFNVIYNAVSAENNLTTVTPPLNPGDGQTTTTNTSVGPDSSGGVTSADNFYSGAPNNSVPDFREQTYGRGDAESTAAARNMYNALKSLTLRDGSPTEASKRIAIIEASSRVTAIYGTNVKLGNAHAEPISTSGDPTGGYIHINPREVYSLSYTDPGTKVVFDANVYSEPLSRTAHELTHVSDFIQFGYSTSLQREFEAVRVENQILNLIGFPVRTHYGKDSVPDYDKYIPKPSGPSGP